MHVEPLMGEADAAAEWGAEGRGHAVFLHTPSYDAACEPQTLYLVGRRGTGKTAVLRMLQWETRMGRRPPFLCSWTLDQVASYRKLAIQLRGTVFESFRDPELELVTTLMWRWVILVAAMAGVVWQSTHHQLPRQDELLPELDDLMRFLRRERVLTVDDDDVVRAGVDAIDVLCGRVLDAMDALGSATPPPGKLLKQVEERLHNAQFQAAARSLEVIVSRLRRSPLVLVDSVDEHDLKDNIARAVTVGLMKAAEELYLGRGRSGAGILAKAAFPSEIYPHLRLWNPDKVAAHASWIIWKHGDLVSLVAKRYRYYLQAGRAAPGEPGLDDHRSAAAYLEPYLPESVTTREGVGFAALPFVFRHTQKKPRQVIALFNAILSLARERGFAPERRVPQSVILDAIFGHGRAVAEGIYQVYEHLYKEASRLVMGTLGNQRALFTASDLDAFMKQVSDVRDQHGITRDEVRQLLLDAGVVGKVARKSQVRAAGGHTVEVVQVQFQYQKTEVLSILPTDELAIHPMFYEQLATPVPRNLFVYPIAVDGEPTLAGDHAPPAAE